MTRSTAGESQSGEVLLNDATSVTPTMVAPALPVSDALATSRFVQRVRRRYADSLTALDAGVPSLGSMQLAYARLLKQGLSIGTALRVTRQLCLERLAVLDCEQACPLDVITRSMTDLAEFALGVACQITQTELDAVHGAPVDAVGQRAALWVVGMGKLGARELNVSSDIDLIYVYDQDGETTGSPEGRGRISHHEYFAKAVRMVSTLMSDVTEHGFVFRVDLALRPNGNSGPPAVSLDALEEYFQLQGREWERFAWLKSRVVATLGDAAPVRAVALRNIVLPFVFRRYLDYGVFESLRILHAQIRDHAAKRAAGRPERSNDVKLSRGGIREIEFTVQLLQVVRGGQFPELRTRQTVDALQRLARAGLMPHDTAQRMAAAYVFLRRVEHRIQYLDDQQTHVLPGNDHDLAWIARTMGFAQAHAFLDALDTHRERVAAEFDKLLGVADSGPDKSGCKSCGPSIADNSVNALTTLLTQLPERFAKRVTQWGEHPRVLALREDSRKRLLRLLQRTAQWLQTGHISEDAAVRMTDWMEPLLRRESYLALLLERPAVHERLLRLLGAARWPARYLMQHPGVIDELASDALLHERFDATQFDADLTRRMQSLRATGQDDDEALMNLLRRAHHAEVFRTLARDVEGAITVEQVADDLSALADAVLTITARWCWERLKSRHTPTPQLAIIAYGKLGGKELGYGSDLDIVFVYDDADDNAATIYAAWVRKLINWLTVKTADGDLYEIDTALRPNGNSGLLVTSLQAYADYQTQRGSNTAWTWEHQAMTRARCVLGPQALRAQFDAIRTAVITSERDATLLQQEIATMRDKVRAAHPVKTGLFDIKHSPGGMVDIEFAVQYLVLSQSARHAALQANVGNIALLQRAQQQGLLGLETAESVGVNAAQAYREFRQQQHRARLNEAPTQVEANALQQERAAVQRLWQQVFGQAGSKAVTTDAVDVPLHETAASAPHLPGAMK
jgi:[glutamine synthetase] adenylyltransferase / [glutamine synthetase]-adenylyl-L-tyrosine phosphorylase